MTSNPRYLCVFVAEIAGGDRLAARLGEAESTRAVERCLNRVDLAIGTADGEIVVRDRSAIIATFEECDGGVMAACEAIERVRKLPPVSGTQTQLRVAIHYGEIQDGAGEGLEGARLILQACDADQSLASATVINRLSPALRKFAVAKTLLSNTLGKLPWPVFTVHMQSIGTASTTPATHSHLELASPPSATQDLLPPLITPDPSSLTTHPPSTRPLAPPPALRMRLKHHQNVLFVDRNRPVVLLGRELGNDIVIIDPRASRQHARIELRREKFILIDASTNGCFVALKGQRELCLKDDELLLTGAGCFGCGFPSQEFEDDLVFFEVV